jgi:hypothetical protein
MKIKVTKNIVRKHHKRAPLRRKNETTGPRKHQEISFENLEQQEEYLSTDTDEDISSSSDEDSSSSLDSKISGSDREFAIDERSQLKEVFISMGLKDHLVSYAVPGKSAESQSCNINTLIGRASSFVLWAYNVLQRQYQDDSIESISPEMIVWTLTKVISKHFTILDKYCKNVLAAQSLRAGTINNHLLDISKVGQWHAHYRESWEKDGPETHQFVYFKDHIKLLSKQYNKLARLEGNEKSMDREIQLGRLPVGGLSALQEAVKKTEGWISNLLEQNFPISRSNYLHFMGILFAAMYVDSPQGRIGGIQHVGVDQFQKLMSENFATTTKFKTSGTFGLQAITCRAFSKKLLLIYWKKFRPVVSKDTSATEENKLFLNFSGEPMKSRQIGQLISSTYKSLIRVNVTATGCRTLVETACQDAFDEGLITQTMRESVSNINTHGSQITKKHYTLKNRAKDTKNATQAFDILESRQKHMLRKSDDDINWEDFDLDDFSGFEDSPQPGVWQSDEVAEMQVDQPAVGFITPHARELASEYDEFRPNPEPGPVHPSAIEWGTRHPDFGKQDQNGGPAQFRAKWTDDELHYIRKCSEQILTKNPQYKATIKAKCLQHIRSDPEAYPIFHYNHVRDSGRICHGYKRAFPLADMN